MWGRCRVLVFSRDSIAFNAFENALWQKSAFQDHLWGDVRHFRKIRSNSADQAVSFSQLCVIIRLCGWYFMDKWVFSYIQVLHVLSTLALFLFFVCLMLFCAVGTRQTHVGPHLWCMKTFTMQKMRWITCLGLMCAEDILFVALEMTQTVFLYIAFLNL